MGKKDGTSCENVGSYCKDGDGDTLGMLNVV